MNNRQFASRNSQTADRNPVFESLEARLCLAAGANSFIETDLVSNTVEIPAAHTDANLANAWGLAINKSNGAIWISNAGTHTSTAYTADGAATGPVVRIPNGEAGEAGEPTGIVYNGSSDFLVTSGAQSGPAAYLFASVDGTISGWNFTVDSDDAILVVDRSASDASYFGLAIGKFGGRNLIYAADFAHKRIDVFGPDYQPVRLPGRFKDPNLPTDYSPFNIQKIKSKLYVAFVKRDPDENEEVIGRGLGIVDVFNLNGKLEKRLISGGKLNAPWAIIQAPPGFGPFANAILVGNFGNGQINAFNQGNGKFLGVLQRPSGNAISIDELWGLKFGNGTNAGSRTTLFFAAGPNDETDGLFGKLEPAT